MNPTPKRSWKAPYLCVHRKSHHLQTGRKPRWGGRCMAWGCACHLYRPREAFIEDTGQVAPNRVTTAP